MAKIILSLAAGALLSGCAAITPLSSLLSTPGSGPPPLQVHDQTSVTLAEDNFMLVKTNVSARSRGFSLLGLITIVPPTLTKAMNGLYEQSDMRVGKPQTLAHLIIERANTYWILFGIPEVDVRADVVEFKPAAKPEPKSEPVTPAGDTVR